jgi:hypothetical protein
MSNVKNIRAVSEADEAWGEIMAAGIRAMAEQGIALRPKSATLLLELDDEFKGLQFPPGEAATQWIVRKLAEAQVNEADGD